MVFSAVTAVATVGMAVYARELNAFGKQQAKRDADAQRLRLAGIRQAAEFELITAETLVQNACDNWQAVLLAAQRGHRVVPQDVPGLFEALKEQAAREVLGALMAVDEMYSMVSSMKATLERSYWLVTVFIPVPSDRRVQREILRIADQLLPLIRKAQAAAGFRSAASYGVAVPPTP